MEEGQVVDVFTFTTLLSVLVCILVTEEEEASCLVGVTRIATLPWNALLKLPVSIELVICMFTKYGEHQRDSLKLLTKISLNFVILGGNHQIW